MIDNQTMKHDALESLSGNWGKSVLAVFLFAVISTALTLLTNPLLGLDEITTLKEDIIANIQGTLINYVLLMPLYVGTTWMLQSLVQGERPSFGFIFSPFRRFWRYMLTGLILVVLLTFWTLLLVIPGIIKFYSYSQTLYILREHPDYSPLDAIRESKEKMRGFKWALFVLQLSFIGWAILSIFTLFIGLFWLEPYVRTTMASFYELKIKQASK
ncbi:DUF975 family protein [Terribacillus sp. 179-K 1B1 HS]|uniref:DUF975 family protein n=1 Tax=Terribacillus sp. 179-K 1B1 HS TaxID=3142388 RepID=UPI0039A1667A